MGPQDQPTVKPGASSGPDPVVVKMSDSQIQSVSDPAPPSRTFQETQLVRDGVVKAASTATEDAVGKVIKTEAAAPDNGLLNSSGQDLQKAAEPAAVQKESQPDQAVLRNQTLDQIVRRAAIHLRNGHHEAQIDLKPDLLGHIRMQVVSANHQVTVKIIAEHGFVKDMIESNIHQLKSDLQQQGLEVDKLEVTVSRDPEDSGNYKDKLAQSKARPDRDGRPNDDAPAKEKKRESAAPARPPDSEATVDYFA
jgi:flagellar hook-length control protein FliK